MQRWRGVEGAPPGWGRCVVTIGVFDGVHRGHQQIVRSTVEQAAEAGVPSLVLTFDPHPIEVLRPGSHPPMLTGVRQKAELLEALGIDVMCVLPFTRAFSQLTAQEFVHEILVERLHAATVLVGENFRFGSKGAGDVASLAADGRRFGFSVIGAPLQGLDDRAWSSTYVRSCVDAGDMAAAAAALGRDHRVDGVVVRGDQRGRELGYPTANLQPLPWSAVPADGIYAGRLVRSSGELLPAAVSVGTNPTFAGRERRVEAFVLDAAPGLDLYGEQIGLTFAARLRDTVRFDGVPELIAQMDQDVVQARALLADHPVG